MARIRDGYVSKENQVTLRQLSCPLEYEWLARQRPAFVRKHMWEALAGVPGREKLIPLQSLLGRVGCEPLLTSVNKLT